MESNTLKKTSLQNITLTLLVLMCVHYSPLEGDQISPIKVIVMGICPVIWLMLSPKFSLALLWGGIYLVAVLFSALFNPESFRFGTIGYLSLFIFMFICYYNLVFLEDALELKVYKKTIRILIYAYAICLVLQQISRLIGVEYLPLINLYGADNRGLLIGRSLSLEQSYSARVLPALFLSLIRLNRIEKAEVNLRSLLKQEKGIIISFLWSMLSMGSATAIASLAILSIYFIKRKYTMIIIPIIIIGYLSINKIDYPPIQRARVSLQAALTLDKQAIYKADASAAGRIIPIINTLKLNLKDKKTWFGKGIDNESKNYFNITSAVGGITPYGLICYILSLIFVYKCMIRRFWSIESLMFLLTLGAGLYNISFYWGILMIFSTTMYFQNKYSYEQ